MTLPAAKKRKTDHATTPDSEEEEASFASLNGSESGSVKVAGGAEYSNGQGAGSTESEDDEKDVHTEDQDEASDEEEEEAEAARSPILETKTRQPKEYLQNGQRKQAAQPAMERGGGAAFTGGTFKSNMFKLQVDELLSQVRPKHGRREVAAEEALHKIKGIIEHLPDRGPHSVAEAERELLLSNKVAMPFPNPRPPKDAKYKLEYRKPASINVVGSYPLKIGSRAADKLEIDMVVVMPSAMFQEKDYMNHRYFYKRAYYLACVAAGLKASKDASITCQFSLLHDNPLQPVLTVSPAALQGNKESKPVPKWCIKIIPAAPEGTFPAERTRPDKGCVRTHAAPDSNVTISEPTPLYNSSLRADTLVVSYLKLLHGASTSSEAYKDACLLGSTWLRQRGFSGDITKGGFGNFEWSALMALLLQGGGNSGAPILSPGYSSYQMFKATLQIIATRDMSKQPLATQSKDNILPKAGGCPLLWDGLRSHELLYKTTVWSYRSLRQEAKTTLTMLGNSLFDGFDSAFILRSDTYLYRYDHIVKIPQAALPKDRHREHYRQLEADQKIHEVLVTGLGDRVSQIILQSPASAAWDTGSARPNSASRDTLTIGFTVNPETIARTIDHGPSAESKTEAAAFRKFWGEKAELRRFKDGSILESLIWTASESGPSIFEQIIRHVLERHVSQAASEEATFSGDGFARMLRHANGLSAFQPLLEAYKILESDIRGLEDMPLTVRQMMPVDLQLRYASVEASTASSAKLRATPADVIIQFEGSARWPDELVAIQRTKIAFLLKLKELLQASSETVEARIGQENEEQDILNQAYMDVIYETGFAFRLRIYHDREQTLIERQLKDKSSDPRTKETAALALAAYKRNFIIAPIYTQAVQKLCTRYPALSPSMRLTKKWFVSHLLSDHFPDELIELFVIRTFVQPCPWQTPSSITTGFLRTLFFLSRWDWRNDPLIVDLNGELKAHDISGITTRFEAWRKLDPSLNRVVLFAASSVDAGGTTWTDGSPSKVVAARLSALARAATVEAETAALRLEPASLFASPLSDYDFVIHLAPQFSNTNSKKSSKKSTIFKNLEMESLSDSSLVGYEPVRLFVEEVKQIYGQAVLLFYALGEGYVAGLWSPQAGRRSWKVNLAYSTMPLITSTGGEPETDVNRNGVLAEIARLGGDLVSSVEVNAQ